MADKAPLDLASALALEHQVWDALQRGDPAADAALLHERFLGVYATGFADRAQHAAQLAAGPIVTRCTLHEARLMVLKPDLVMLAYLAVFRRPSTPEGAPDERMFISSLWQQFEHQRWLNVFSQDTSAE